MELLWIILGAISISSFVASFQREETWFVIFAGISLGVWLGWTANLLNF